MFYIGYDDIIIQTPLFTTGIPNVYIMQFLFCYFLADILSRERVRERERDKEGERERETHREGQGERKREKKTEREIFLSSYKSYPYITLNPCMQR